MCTFATWSDSLLHCVLESWRRCQDHVSEASGSTLTKAWQHVLAAKKDKGKDRRGQEVWEERRKWLLCDRCPKSQTHEKHGVTSHLHHTGSITLQSPLPSTDNIASLPWQPLIDPSLGRAGGGRGIGKVGKMGWGRQGGDGYWWTEIQSENWTGGHSSVAGTRWWLLS